MVRIVAVQHIRNPMNHGHWSYVGLFTWWRHQMETFSALLAICAGNSPVPGEFPTQRPVARSFDVYFDLRPDKRLSKQSWGWWFETLSHSLWRHRNVIVVNYLEHFTVIGVISSTAGQDTPVNQILEYTQKQLVPFIYRECTAIRKINPIVYKCICMCVLWLSSTTGHCDLNFNIASFTQQL